MKCIRYKDRRRGTRHQFFNHSRKCACGDLDLDAAKNALALRQGGKYTRA